MYMIYICKPDGTLDREKRFFSEFSAKLYKREVQKVLPQGWTVELMCLD